MSSASDEKVRRVTSQLNDERLWDLSMLEPDVAYRSVPRADATSEMTWRVRFDTTYDSTRRFGLDINGEVVFGRGENGQGFIGLSEFDADRLGVSRHHIAIRPTDTKLFVLDLGSTNGTRLNGRSIGLNTPYSISSGDLLKLGDLEFAVRIIKRPSGHTAALNSKADLADVVLPIAHAIMSQLTLEDVLKQSLEMTMAALKVDEVSIWLVDETSGELFLEAERGIKDEQIHRMRLPVAETLPGKVIASGKPVRANRESGNQQIKVKTGYLVEAVIYVPLTLAGVTFGVLSAAHRKEGRSLTAQDEKVIAAIADFTAIAVQNARMYQATDQHNIRRGKVITALSYVLSFEMKQSLNAALGYAGMLRSMEGIDGELLEHTENILMAGNYMSNILDRLEEFVSLSEAPVFKQSRCDLVDAVGRAVDDLYPDAQRKSMRLDFEVIGDPYLIYGDVGHLYRSVLNLVDNAIKFSPTRSEVSIKLVFGSEILLRVRDQGPGIAEDDLPHLFDRYLRGTPPSGEPAGLGLGLELVRATVQAHRGTVVARNVEPHGAEFIISLPTGLRA